MRAKNQNNLVDWDDHLDKKYGKCGTAEREQYETDFDTFKLGVMLQEARRKRNFTQRELAVRAGTTKNYISRIENNMSDIRFNTLQRIVHKGLGGRIQLSVAFS